MLGLQVFGLEGAAKATVEYGDAVGQLMPQANLKAALVFEKSWKLWVSGPGTRSKVGRRSGAYGRSITTKRMGTAAATGTRLPYPRIHELGGTTRPHVILPRTRKVLRFTVGGQVVFSRKVNHPGSKIPARPSMEPALRLVRPAIDAIYEGVPDEAARRAKAVFSSLRRHQLKLAKAA